MPSLTSTQALSESALQVSSVAPASPLQQTVAAEVLRGLTAAPKTLPPWLFYDERGSQLFEQITTLPEYYLTRTERSILAAHADAILATVDRPVTIAELGAGTATKTGLLLAAATRRQVPVLQTQVLYQPIDVSPTALDEAREHLENTLPGVTVRHQTANYITERIIIERPPNTRILALYIGSSIGNFSLSESRAILSNLRAELQPGDALLLGTDLAPGGSGFSSTKSIASLLAAYDDAQGVTAAFNVNILERINRDLGTDFRLRNFRHKALWNADESRIEMHLESLTAQTIRIPATPSTPPCSVTLAHGETIHTENSRKFTTAAIASLLTATHFTPTEIFHDPDHHFALNLAIAT